MMSLARFGPKPPRKSAWVQRASCVARSATIMAMSLQNPTQVRVLRASRKLVDEGRLVRLGFDVYGRATVSSLSGKGRYDDIWQGGLQRRGDDNKHRLWLRLGTIALAPAPCVKPLVLFDVACLATMLRYHTQAFLKSRRNKVEEGAQLQRLLPVRGIDELYRDRRRRPLGQDRQ
jgi:hypothetical protein